ncbi:hypothetical protein [Granulicella sibirica]|uniref:Carboxypeptidase regulatory-like domain-containing protein n=1 Tax=Granulicella sibirica TaxID=2479048 RepID=A0A4Q0T2Q7_9BACT|nr:hypothetical protein [Granulicella sibirica]RXH56308.1 hypothetical protein GRAN_3165 [Granulicella sibirica]
MTSRTIRSAIKLAAASGLALSLMPFVLAQDAPKSRGRKYKPPPETSHIEVLVTKGYNHKPIPNAAVIFHEIREDGKDLGNLEVKTDPDGKAIIDVIPTGSNLRVQVLANGFATYAEDFLISESSRQIPVEMLRPREQISTYVDNSGKASTAKAGVQEPVRPKTADPKSKSVPAPASTTPPPPTPLPPSEQNTPAPVSNPPAPPQ